MAAPFPIGHPTRASNPIDWTIEESSALPVDAHERAPVGHRIAGIDGDMPFYDLYALDTEQYVLRFTGIADVRISTGRRLITWHLLPGVDPARIEVLTSGTVTAVACLLDSHLVLHASAVEQNGRAVAFVGDTAAGKSTVAALCCLGGARLVTDDVLRVERDGGTVRCFRGANAIRLRQSSRALIAGLSVTSTTVDNRVLATPPLTDHDLLELERIVLPHLDDSATVLQLEPLDAHTGALAVLAAPRVLGWRHTNAAELFDRLMDIASAVPISRLVVPRRVTFGRADAERLASMLT